MQGIALDVYILIQLVHGLWRYCQAGVFASGRERVIVRLHVALGGSFTTQIKETEPKVTLPSREMQATHIFNVVSLYFIMNAMPCLPLGPTTSTFQS